MMPKRIFIFLDQNVTVSFDGLYSTACSGTVFSTMILANQLAKNHDFEVTIGHKGSEYTESFVNFVSVINEIDILRFIDMINPDIFIVSGNNHSYFDFIDKPEMLKIYWLHNHVDLASLERSVSSGKIDRVVNVCSYQYGRMFTKPRLMKNSTFIYNPYPTDEMEEISPIKISAFANEFDVKIAFIGALVPEKGIFNLFWVFDKLSSKGLKVRLDIFGCSNLYGDCKNIGVTKALSKELELSMSKLLFNPDGTIKEGLFFHGALGKKEILSKIIKSDVFLSGLNEFGPSECFPISFLDSQCVGVPVYTLNRGGQSEAILSKTNGRVFSNLDALIDGLYLDIVSNSLRKVDFGNGFEKVHPKHISDAWVSLFLGEKPSMSKMIHSFVKYLFVMKDYVIFGKVFKKYRY